MIDFSIIIPHYNIPNLLVRCINSIPCRDNVEIIVVDDNSPNVETYFQKYPTLNRHNLIFLKNECNLGGGGCRNIGLKKARGRWLIFADADDFFNPCFNDLLNQYSRDSSDVIFFKSNSLDSDTYENSNRDNYLNKRVGMYLCDSKKGLLALRYSTFCPWGKFIKRDLVEKYNIRFEETKKCNDVGFSYHVGHYASSIKVVPVALYCITTRKNSVSVVFSNDIRLTIIGVYSRYYSFLKHELITSLPLLNLNEVKRQLMLLRYEDKESYKSGLEVAINNKCPQENLPTEFDYWVYCLKRFISEKIK